MHGFETIESSLGQGFAQQMDLAAQGIGFWQVIAPQGAFNFSTRNDPPRITQEQFDDAPALWGQVHLGCIDVQLVAARIET